MRAVIAGATCMALLGACSDDQTGESPARATALLESLETHGGALSFAQPLEGDLAAIPQDPRNKLTPAKVALGQLLYHETALAISPLDPERVDTYSCASCHFASAGFQAGIRQGIGEGGLGAGGDRVADPWLTADRLDVQPVRTPSTLNVAYQEVMLWNGQFGYSGPNAGTDDNWDLTKPTGKNFLGYHGVETQAIAGIDVHRLSMGDEEKGGCATMESYQTRFDAAFPEVELEERYSNEMAGLAIAAYERTLLANRSPFQRFLQGDVDALSADELDGALLFFGKAGCASCHSGPSLAAMEFHALGMPDLVGDGVSTSRPDDATRRGRGGFTGKSEDDYKFKTPQLYNLIDSPFYGHGGNFTSVRDVVDYKNRAVPMNGQVPRSKLSPSFVPLGLSEREVDLLTTFLETALYDPELSRYEPEALPSGMCFPVADDRAKEHLECSE